MREPEVWCPRYLTRFRCIGSACEDHCCGGWQSVDVDGGTLERYQAIGDSAHGSRLQQWVRANPNPVGPEDAGLIPILDTGRCPFLGADQLCVIQSSLGEELLPATCDTFPRQAMLIDGRIDLAGRLACPEVARLALLAADAMELVQVESDRRLRERGRYWVEVPWDEVGPGDPREHYHLVRRLCLGLLRRREYSLTTRLQALGLALDSLNAWPKLDGDDVQRVFGEATARMDRLENRIGLNLDSTVGPPQVVVELFAFWHRLLGVPARYQRCLDRVAIGLRLQGGSGLPIAEVTRRAYADGLARLHAYLDVRPHVLENALVNGVLVGNFPFHPSHTFFEEQAVLVCRYAMIVLHLVGAAALGPLTDATLVETIQAFDKYADGPDLWDRALVALRERGELSQAGLTRLLGL